VLNKLIGSICGGGKQARTQGSMIGQEKIDFEANTRVGRHWNHAQYFKYRMLSNCPRLSGVRHKAERHLIRKTWR